MSPCRGTLRLLEADHYCLPIQSQVVTLSTARFELACTYFMTLQITSDRQAEVAGNQSTEAVTNTRRMAAGLEGRIGRNLPATAITYTRCTSSCSTHL